MNQARIYLDSLSDVEQTELLLNLTDYAEGKARGKGWRTGNHVELSDAETCFSVVSLAFERVLENRRVWNPETEPSFKKYMLDVIDSLLSHLATGKDNRLFVNENSGRYAAVKDKENVGVLAVAEEKFIAAKDRKQFENSEWLVRKQPSPEDESIIAEEKNFNDAVLQAIYEAIADDAEVAAMVGAMERGIEKPEDIADYAKIDVERIYNARRRLNTVKNRIRQKFKI